MTLAFRLLRPDDLVVLSVEASGLDLDTTDTAHPVLRPSADAKDSLLVYEFQPQHFAERAYFDASGPPVAPNENPPSKTTSDILPPPGSVLARISGTSRLVFRVPRDGVIPYTLAGLLDWSWLEPVLTPIAAWDASSPGDAAPDIVQPGPNETSIELPFRLMLSPITGHAWSHATTPIFSGGRTQLWHTLLVARDQSQPPSPLPLRAVWSPDYRPLPQPMPDHSLDDRPFPMSLTPRDRHQIVVRTSAFKGYETSPDLPYVPSPVLADRLAISALGGWLSSRGVWNDLPYPASTQDTRRSYYAKFAAQIAHTTDRSDEEQQALLSPELMKILGHGNANVAAGLLRSGELTLPADIDPGQLDLSGWDHQTSQGRDQYVCTVHEGFFYPFGHRCAVVIVTERRFQAAPPGPQAGSPVAYLRQYAFIVRREVERSYDVAANDYQRRALPLSSLIRIETAVTPHIDLPSSSQIPGTTYSFWVRVGGSNYPFQLVGRDIIGREIPFSGALVFVTVNEARMDLVQQAYAADDVARAFTVPSRGIVFAPPSGAGADDTTLVASSLTFDAGGSIGAWIPSLAKADVRVPALEQLLGTSMPTTISLFAGYLSNGIDGQAGVFADLRPHVPDGLPVGFSADRAGGIATPNLAVTGLSRSMGPIAGTLENAAAGTFDPSSYFPKSVLNPAQIFGSISLADLIPSGSVGKNAPRISVFPTPPAPAPPQTLTTTIHWEPDITSGSIAGLLLTSGDTRLVIDGKLVKPLDERPGTSEFSGRLSTFTLEIAGVVRVHFDSFSFRSASGAKPSVAVALTAVNPVEFLGALAFVADLAKFIPSDGFGGGSGIDVSPTGLTIGYGIGLPPFSVAVFGLTDLRFAAGLTLPFLSGKPHVDFAFAERSHPFLLTVECLGGGGFLHVELDTQGVILVEGALEFGGQFSLDIGVASGGVHVLAGIYFKLAALESELAGFVDVGGEVSVLGLMSISVEFNLTLAYFPDKNKAQGRATLVVAVHVAFFSQSVELSVERSFGGKGGDPSFKDMTTAVDWQNYAAAFA
jgi:hypothetical protein